MKLNKEIFIERSIRSWEDFCTEIREGLDNPVDIRWVDKGIELGGFFVVNDKTYSIICKDKGDNIWTYKFYRFDDIDKKLSPDLTKDNKNVFRVLPTVELGLSYLIDIKNLSGLIYGALDRSEGRKKLYHSFSEKLADKYGFIYNTSRSDDKQIYILYKPNFGKDIIFNKVREIVEENMNEI